MRWNIGCHAHSDSRRAIDEQVRDARRKNLWLPLAIVVIWTEVDRFLFDILQQRAGYSR